MMHITTHRPPGAHKGSGWLVSNRRWWQSGSAEGVRLPVKTRAPWMQPAWRLLLVSAPPRLAHQRGCHRHVRSRYRLFVSTQVLSVGHCTCISVQADGHPPMVAPCMCRLTARVALCPTLTSWRWSHWRCMDMACACSPAVKVGQRLCSACVLLSRV